MDDKKSYGAESIKVLEGLEGVRRRPAMYIGSTGKEGLHHLVYEVVDNSVDEALAGFCKKIVVKINKDGSVSVEDDGRGIPVGTHSQFKIPAVQVALTKLHAGGKFDKKSYQISGGLHGVGVSCVNALSKKLIVEIKRDGKVYSQEYSRGDAKTKLKVIGKYSSDGSGTKITFWPDEEIFSILEFDYKFLETRFREIAFLNAGLRILLIDESKNKSEEFFSSGGLIEFVKWINKSKEVLHKPIYFKRQVNGTIVEIAIQYNSGYRDNIFGFVNTINTVEGGTHVSGFKTALTRAINDYAKRRMNSKNGSLMGDDVREGLTAIISIKIAEPQFEGQTKTKLGNSEIKGFVDSIVTSALTEFFEENPSVAKKIVSKAMDSAKARLAAKKAKDLVRRKNAFSVGGLPGKLHDCANRKADNTELYLVEGESAGGCFSGDTKVALVDGRNLSFRELVQEDNQSKINFCYTITKDGCIDVAKIENPRTTKKNAQVIKVVLDSGEEIVCTPNHKFMLRLGGYKEAKDLTKEDSLMPLNRKFSKIGGKITIDGYEMFWDNKKKMWIFTHLLGDGYNLINGIYSRAQGDHRHHIDFNKLNNNPTNLIRMSKEDHLILHTKHLQNTLHREDIKEKAREAHRKFEYREKVSEWANQSEVRNMLSNRAKKQWESKEYKKFMRKKFKEFCENNPKYVELNKKILNNAQEQYWSDPKNREKASLKVKKFFEENPETKAYLSHIAKKQWSNASLIEWRRQKTKEQWTPEFRKQRKESYNKTYYKKTIMLMKKVLEDNGTVSGFDKVRIENNDKSILSMQTFCSRFFENNPGSMLEAVKNYNHKIKKIEWLNKKIDVYDLEVKETHNFALSSGVFVHNSAKNARDKNTQAILPLKGKILNVEKSSSVRALSSEEIMNIITAVGTGVGEQFNLEKLRYSKIIIMCDADSVTYDTPILLFNKKTKMMESWLVGDFIENKIDFRNYQVMSFDKGNLIFSDISNVIKHPVRTKIYSIESMKKYNVEVTGDHSVYIYADGKIVAKEVRNIRKGEFLVIPNKIPSIEKNIEIDLSSELENLSDFQKKNVWLRVNKKDIKKIPENALIDICLDDWKKIKLKRQDKFSRRELSRKLGIYFTILQQWEFKNDNVKPKFNLLKKYFNLVGLNLKNFNYNVLINYYDFEKDINDKSLLNKAELFNLNTANPFKLKYKLDKDLAYFLGVYLGDGCYSFNKKSPNRFIFSLNTEDKIFYLPRLEAILKDKFGISFIQCVKGKSLQLYFHSFAFTLLLKKLGLFKLKSAEKFISNIFYNAMDDIKKSLLEGILHTDGYIHSKEKRLVYTSISKKLIVGILNLFRQLGVFANFQTRKAHIKDKRNNKERYDLIINYSELNKIKDIWENHKKGDLLSEELKKSKIILKRKDFFKISKDFSVIKITNIKEINYAHKNVYDFSVKKTQNFIAGIGSILLHNTDGEHIKTLILTFFFRFMPELIKSGHIYTAMPPLFRVRKKKDYYVYSEEELKKLIEKLGPSNTTRFKGLGEMSSSQLWETTMNPKTRKIKRIFIEDALVADQTFSMLMGDDVQARKEFIQENAKRANLDV